MTPYQVGTLFVAIWMIGIPILYDIFVMWIWRQPSATISVVLRSWCQFTPLVLLPLGMLLWHLFGCHCQHITDHDLRGWAPVVMLVVGALLYALCGIASWPDMGPPIH